MDVFNNYNHVRKRVPNHVKLVVAAKSRKPVEVLEAIKAGAEHVGENYIQEAGKVKKELGAVADKVTWHLIGHLQRNKVKRALKVFDVIQTIDSLKLAGKVSDAAQKPVVVYVQVNVGREPSKHGFDPSELLPAVNVMRNLNNLQVKGLMTIEPFTTSAEESRQHFREMKRLFEEVKRLNIPNISMEVLSMGMSDTFQTAIEEGSNMIRVGTAIFGHRERVLPFHNA
jgi:pyridoxal phosphate enzyme (YggS family)